MSRIWTSFGALFLLTRTVNNSLTCLNGNLILEKVKGSMKATYIPNQIFITKEELFAGIEVMRTLVRSEYSIFKFLTEKRRASSSLTYTLNSERTAVRMFRERIVGHGSTIYRNMLAQESC